MPASRYDEIYEIVVDFMNPPTKTVAMESGKVDEWSAAMEAELPSMWEKEVFEEVERPAEKKVIGTKWVLRVKTDAARNIDEYKARVVAKGYRLVEGVDYDKTFALTLRFEHVRASRTFYGMGVGSNGRGDGIFVCEVGGGDVCRHPKGGSSGWGG